MDCQEIQELLDAYALGAATKQREGREHNHEYAWSPHRAFPPALQARDWGAL